MNTRRAVYRHVLDNSSRPALLFLPMGFAALPLFYGYHCERERVCGRHTKLGGVLFFLVTNKHKVEDAEGGWFHFLTSSGPGTPALGHGVQVEAPSYTQAWHARPNPEVDIAVLSLNQMLHYRQAPDELTVGEITSAVPVRSIHVPAPERIETLDAIENIVYIGYPYGRYDKLNLTPITRKEITTPLQLITEES